MKIVKLLLLVTLFLNAGFESALKNQNNVLSPEEAFKVKVEESGDAIEAIILLADKIHLTADTLKFKVIKPKEFELNVSLPTPHKDKISGSMVYDGEVVVNIPLEKITSQVEGAYTLMVEFEGCSDRGVCYAKVEKTYNFNTLGMGFFDRIINLTQESNAGNIVDVLQQES